MLQICPRRQELLDCTDHALVLGGPGSGKTTIALKKAVRRIDEGLALGQSVLFLSFSRAAVARIAEASQIEAAKHQRSLLNVQTFHSFFWAILRPHAYLLGTPRKVHILLPHDERALSNGIKEGELLWPAWITERDRLCRENGRICFDLFAPLVATLLEKSAHLRQLVARRHPLLIVDEAQDTNTHAWHCIELLAPDTQVVCLADLEQQIFDYLPGIGPERIETIKKVLSPLLVDLGSENYRSPDSEIIAFARDILAGTPRGLPYKGVSRVFYNPKSVDWAMTIRKGLGILKARIHKATGQAMQSVAILLPSGAAAVKLSGALSAAELPVRHRLLFDEAEAMLAARFAAFLLEPRKGKELFTRLAEALELLADMKRVTGAADANTFQKWAAKVAVGKMPSAAFVKALRSLLENLPSLSGHPGNDWLTVKNALRSSGDSKLTQVARHLDYLIAFNRGKRISANLSEMWQRDGEYTDARRGLELALAQDQILGGIDNPRGVQVMTIHKAKAKQFDGVIIIREFRRDGDKFVSAFVWKGDGAPYYRSRRILRVAITRARLHVLIIDSPWPVCPILGPHKL
jgi:DNA helicase-2/ATP-dependent DNA helicase PcrA